MNEQRPLLLSETSLSHSSVIVSASLLLAALMGAGQALLVVFIIGEGNDTDAFLAGYSIYFVFAGFGASMRASVVPLLGHAETDEGFRARVAEVLSRIRLIGLVALGVLLLVSPFAGQVLTHGLPADDRWTAVLTVLILSPAAYMQLQAASASATLTAGRRFLFSATLYVASGVVALACSAVLLEAIGILGGAFGLLAGAVVLEQAMRSTCAVSGSGSACNRGGCASASCGGWRWRCWPGRRSGWRSRSISRSASPRSRAMPARSPPTRTPTSWRR